eukprot:4598380-Amphidinium_carterae.1
MMWFGMVRTAFFEAEVDIKPNSKQKGKEPFNCDSEGDYATISTASRAKSGTDINCSCTLCPALTGVAIANSQQKLTDLKC